MNRTKQLLIAFILGQVLQLAIHWLGELLVSGSVLLVCAVVGVLVGAAFYVGVLLANHEQNTTNLSLEEVFGDETAAH